MVDAIATTGDRMTLEPARGRQTVDNDFGTVLARGAEQVANVALSGAKLAATVVPGGSFITAVADAAAGQAGAGGIGGSSEKWALLRAQEQLQDEGMADSLRLLTLQKKMQEETEAVNTLSNVMKTRHEMAKAAINNLR